MSTPPTIGDILNNILGAINSVIGAVATAISDNAETIGTVLIVGALVASVMVVGTKVFGGLTRWFKGLLG
jgi:hypothetical protein